MGKFSRIMNEKELELQLQSLDSMLSKCTQCGICLESCATYQATGWEHESPRGRIRLARDFLDGKIKPSSEALDSFDRCLGCKACEVICPVNVPYPSIRNIVQDLRFEIGLKKPKGAHLLKLARRIGKWWWRVFGWKWLPNASRSYLHGHANATGSITLAVSCIQDLYHPEVIAETVQFLKRLGIEVSLDGRQPCCGAIFERFDSKKDQSKCLQKFKKWMPSKTCFLAKNCACSAGKGIDLYELILAKLDEQKITLFLEQPVSAYYQGYCTAAGEDFALKFLNRIQGLQLKTVWPARSCCGGYGGEALIDPEHAASLKKKIPPGSIVIVTSPDCWYQYLQGGDLTVLYPTQLLGMTLKS